MAKGYIVVDIPAKCAGCRFASYPKSNGVCRCNIIKRDIDVSDEDKPDWCPIRPQPERYDRLNIMDEYEDGLVDGRNDLIDVMFGGEV